MGKMIRPQFKFELTIDNFKTTAKFLTKPTDEEISDAIHSLLGGVLVSEDGRFNSDDSILWKITRHRGVFYELGHHLHQDFSNGEILLEREDDNRYYEIQKELERKGLINKNDNDWGKRYKLITDEMRKVPGLVKVIRFTITEI
jgi:hypothetical protein